jgi:hypothetical protein
MTGPNLLLAILTTGVAMLLARKSQPLAGALLAASALAVSAILFLPTGWLIDRVGIQRVYWLYGLADPTPLEPPEWAHVFAFLWLGLVLWLARSDLRSWKGFVLIALLSVASEASQMLTADRTPRAMDAAVNMLGAGTGILLAVGLRAVFVRKESKPAL